MRVLAGALTVLAMSPAAAGADTFTAMAPSPRNPALDASLDLSQVSATFDTAGSWTLDVRVHGGVPSGITGILYAAAPAGACGASVASITTNPDPGNQSAIVTPPGGTPHAPQRLGVTFATAQFVGQVGDPGLAGIRPGCVTVTISNSSGVLDTLSSIPFGAAATPLPNPSPAPTPTPTPPPSGSSSLTIQFTNTGAPLTANRRGVVAVKLGQFSRGVRGTVRVRAGRRTPGRTLGRRTYRASAGRPVTVRVRLNAASRRRLARGRTLSVTIVATARAGGANVRNSFTTTIRRR